MGLRGVATPFSVLGVYVGRGKGGRSSVEAQEAIAHLYGKKHKACKNALITQ